MKKDKEPQLTDEEKAEIEKREQEEKARAEHEAHVDRTPLINDTGLEESAAAKLLRMKGVEPEEEQPEIHEEKTIKGFFSNFWYHHKWKVIITAFFAVALGIGVAQFAANANPDICFLYSGPDYITANDNSKFCAAVKEVISDKDFNEDGTTKISLIDIIYYSENQIEEAKAEVEASGEDWAFNYLTNSETSKQFTNEIFAGDSVICILSYDQYADVMNSGGFMPLSEIFGDEEIEGQIDDYGIRYSDTKFCKYYTQADIFPDDAVLAIRKLKTLTNIAGKAKAEQSHEWHVEVFKAMVNFEYPEGYDPDSAGEQAGN